MERVVPNALVQPAASLEQSVGDNALHHDRTNVSEIDTRLVSEVDKRILAGERTRRARPRVERPPPICRR